MLILFQKDILTSHAGKLLDKHLSFKSHSCFIEHPSHIEWSFSKRTNAKRFLFYLIKSSLSQFSSFFATRKTYFVNPLNIIYYIPRAISIFTKYSIANGSYVHDGHDITNSIIDSRIRFSPFPLYCRGLFDIYYIASYLQTYYSSLSFVHSTKPDFAIALYTCYAQHLGFVHACVHSNIPLYFGYRANLFLSKFRLTYPYHSPDFSHAQNTRLLLTESKSCLLKEISHNVITARKKGSNMGQPYMSKTPLGGTTLSSHTYKLLESSVVLFLHDFYDSPHIYPGLDFIDFLDWTINTIKFLLTLNKRIFIKSHPNQINNSISVSNSITAMFPQVSVLDSSASNHDIFTSKPSLVITAYGNVAVEAAYYGIRSISAVPFSPSSCSSLATINFDRSGFFNSILQLLGSTDPNFPDPPDYLALGLSLVSAYVDEGIDISTYFDVLDSVVATKSASTSDPSQSNLNLAIKNITLAIDERYHLLQ